MHAVCVSDRRAVAGGIGVGLENLDALRQDAFRAYRRRVVLDLRSRSVPKDPFMNKWEVTDVKEVLDDPRPACTHPVRPRDQHVISRIVEQLEPWDPVSATAEAHPDDAVGGRRAKGGHPRF